MLVVFYKVWSSDSDQTAGPANFVMKDQAWLTGDDIKVAIIDAKGEVSRGIYLCDPSGIVDSSHFDGLEIKCWNFCTLSRKLLKQRHQNCVLRYLK